MAKLGELTSPVMRSTASLQPDLGGLQIGKKLKDLPTPQLLAQNRPLVGIHHMQHKTLLDVSIPIRIIFVMDGSLV